MSLLHLSIFFNNWDGFNTLFSIEKCLERWRPDENGNTILHLACESLDTKVLNILHRHGNFTTEFLNRRNNKGQSPFHCICTTDSEEWLMKMINEPQLNFELVCNEGNTPFMTAIFSENLKAAKLLYKKGANINHQNKKGNTALHYACMKNLFTCAEQLIKWNANIDVKNTFELSPLSFAVMNDCQKIFNLLLKNKANVNVVDTNGWTALHHAVKRDNVELLRALLQSGVNVNHRNKNGQTALILACSLNRIEAMDYLLPNASERDLLKAYEYSKQRKFVAVAERIQLYMKMFTKIYQDMSHIYVV